MALSPQTREHMLETAERHRVNFDLLRDEGNLVAKQYGVVFRLPDDLKAVYLNFGIDLAKFNGDDAWELPMPGRVVIGRDRAIRSVSIDPDYTIRPEPEETVDIIRRLTVRAS